MLVMSSIVLWGLERREGRIDEGGRFELVNEDVCGWIFVLHKKFKNNTLLSKRENVYASHPSQSVNLSPNSPFFF